jgi:hypothetical protein
VSHFGVRIRERQAGWLPFEQPPQLIEIQMETVEHFTWARTQGNAVKTMRALGTFRHFRWLMRVIDLLADFNGGLGENGSDGADHQEIN